MRGPEGEEVLGPPPMNQSSEENPPPPPEAGEAGILSCELMEDREAAKGSQLPVSPALSPSFVAGEENPPAFELDAAVTSGVAGGDDSLEEEAFQMTVDVVVERREEPVLPGSAAVSLSSSDGEDKKAPILETDAAITGGDAGRDDVIEEEASRMAVDVVEPQVELPCPSSLVESPSSHAEDGKGPVFWLDAATTSGFAGGDDSLEEGAARMAMDAMEPQGEPHRPSSPMGSPSSSGGGEKKKDLAFETDEAAISPVGGGDVAVEEEDERIETDKAAISPDGGGDVAVQEEDERIETDEAAISPVGGGDVAVEEEDERIETDEAAISPVGGGDVAVEEEDERIAAESLVVCVRRGGGRWKRGRPQKAHVGRAPARRKEEEEVCFICFDGGDLVVCDRRGCPKVYHPSCVNRDEAFFRAKGRWNCGWHICNICEKSSHYMCYTCTYSLCKGCIREGRFICVRGTKGFCETCMNTVMLIETNGHGNEKTDRVDFDDRSSWEFLFKDYWLDLKGKLSLTLEELKGARSPQKDSNLISLKEESSDDLCDAKNEQQASSDSSSGHPEERISPGKKIEENIFAKKKGKKRSRKTTNKETLMKEPENTGTSTSKDISWASEELLEFVAHMKDGDISELSQFDVQALLLEYIKRNNLRDRRRKSQIICDSRLENLFGKSRVGHFEMLKLLESHFLMKEASPLDTDDNQGGVVDPDPMDVEGISDASIMTTSDNRRKSRRKVEEKEPQTNIDDYAAIDVHNISLIYLRRNLMEDLLDDIDAFNEKVVGSFVRIRICGVGQRQDVYRLVQVKGTCKAAEKYKSGKKTTDVMLEILNLDKTEVITIDIISNQEFTEEECKRLRQSIKCGFIGRLTVGEVQEKARVLQAVRVNDWLESEKLRLAHLRDRASEKGRRKELRECVEKLGLLNMPEERNRRLNGVPEIHADPNMSPDYETAEEEEEPDSKRQEHADHYSRSRASALLRKGREVTSPGRGISISGDNWNGSRKNSNIMESNRSILREGASSKSASMVGITNELSWKQGNDVHETRSWEPPKMPTNATGLETGAWNNNQHGLRPAQSSGVQPETPTASLSTGVVVPSNANESEKIWRYQDPSGKTQGPFSMMQLRKWSTTGYFPTNLRIWRTFEKQEDSILLTDALIGKFRNDLPQHEPAHNNLTDNKQNIANWKASQNDANLSTPGINESAKADRLVTRPSAWSAPKTEVVNPNEGGLGTSLRDQGSSKGINAWPGQMQGWNGERTAASFTGSPYQPLSHPSRGSRGGNSGRWNRSQDHGSNWGSNTPMGSQPTGQVYDKPHPHWSSSSQQSSEDMSKVQTSEFPNQWKNDSYNLPTAPQSGSRDSTGDQGALNKSFPSSASVQPMIYGWGTTPSSSEAHRSFYASGMSNKITMLDSVGEWGSSAVTPMLKQSVTADGGNPYPAAMSSMPNAAEVVETMGSSQLPDKVDDRGNFQISSQQKIPPVHESSMTLENQSSLELPCRDEVISPTTDTQLAGGLDKNQCPQSDDARPAPRSEQVSGDILSSGCGETVPSQLNDRQDNRVVWQGQPDLGKKWAEAHDRLADKRKSLVDGRGSDPGSVVDAHDTNLITESYALEPKSAQQSEISSGPNLGSESLGWTSHSAPKQKPDSSCPIPAFAENRSEQNQSQRPESSLAGPECINSHNSGIPSDGKSTEHLMPAPAIKMISSEWSGSGVNSNVGNNQNVQFVSLDGSKPLASSQCEASAELAQPSNAGLSAAAHGQSNFWGVAPQNPNTGTVSQGNANMNWATTIQGNMNMGWGLVAQSNINVSQGTPAQGFANLNMGLGTPPQANMVVNAGWVPAAPGNTIGNPAWGTPFQGNPNPGTGWAAHVQGSMSVNPGWGTVPQGNTNSNPRLVTLPSGNTNQNASWGTPTQGNMDMNSNSTWGSGQGNMNPTWDPSVGDPNSWNTPQAQAGDRHSGQSGSDTGNAAGRPMWNRIQSGGGGGSSRPPRGQRGICRFHENGHCKKGASCNYIHS
ncbi:zinc finger CCCH domain-containing protein 19-like isoform X1 [Phoenix dactylifera]|uniref:Zinc finger CCCH domain-containing protein 19-like isoform X1 n=1 Tax=Phoenix dactylifera TaxID=42345 RepID=A0A8B7D415_PHODC|nr:zinc finger CCCH domain-containing protein 19-like isoform X1 [Phoenix dactylifera]